jgi:hypothetical protein
MRTDWIYLDVDIEGQKMSMIKFGLIKSHLMEPAAVTLVYIIWPFLLLHKYRARQYITRN